MYWSRNEEKWEKGQTGLKQWIQPYSTSTEQKNPNPQEETTERKRTDLEDPQTFRSPRTGEKDLEKEPSHKQAADDPDVTLGQSASTPTAGNKWLY